MFAPGQEVYYYSTLGRKKVFGIVASDEEVKHRFRDQPWVPEQLLKSYPNEGVVFAFWNESKHISYMPTSKVYPSHKDYTPEQSGDTEDDV